MHASAPSTPALRRRLARWIAAAMAGLCAAAAATALSQTSSRNEVSLPRFSGATLDGGEASTDLFQKRRGLVYVFASTDSDAERVASLLDGVRAEAAAANVALLGVNRDAKADLAKHFLRRYGFDFPVIWDRDLQVSRKLRVPPASSSILIVDAGGYVVGGVANLAQQPGENDAAVATELRRQLHLEAKTAAATPLLGVHPPAPPFEVVGLDGKTKLSSEVLKGKVVVLVFFLPTCPHCHDVLKMLDGLEKQLASPDLEIVAVSVSEQKYVVESEVAKLGVSLTPWMDPRDAAQEAYAFGHAVPEVFVIDRAGRVMSRTAGSSPRIQAALTMRIRQTLGAANPILLPRAEYAGEELCSVCHAKPHETWLVTKHAFAFDTLVEHGADRDPECLKCHTVGFGEPGGFDPAVRQDFLRGVQCENCHGRGGPHQSPEFAKTGLEPVCLSCHTPEHSLRFSFAERLPLVSHAANAAQVASLSIEDRRALLAKRDKRSRQLFDEGDYVGSAACQSCHAKEHQYWAGSPHARAFATLVAQKEHGKEDCQRCHTTGFGEPTGFPKGGKALENVGCESCHGPGKAHVDSAGKGPATILALTDKCDDCVILQICGSCHDDANDPNFEFELEEKLARIRHGFRDAKAAGK
jgi:peroxiredoxin